MAGTESLVQVTEGAGKKLHTVSRTIGANVIEDDVSIPGEHYLATYTVIGSGIGATVSADHLLQIMAGAALNVRIRRIRISQVGVPAAGLSLISLLRLTTAGTGGTAVTPQKYDNADAAAGAAGMTLPTAKGTEGALLWQFRIGNAGAQPVLNTSQAEWVHLPQEKPIIIPAGAANGVAFKIGTGVASLSYDLIVELVETNFV